MIPIDSSKVHGEEGTGYENPSNKGPFKCGNCKYFNNKNSSCGQSTMVKISKQPKLGNRVKVDANGCCEYIERLNNKNKNAIKEEIKNTLS